jgi:hypothetical protein
LYEILIALIHATCPGHLIKIINENKRSGMVHSARVWRMRRGGSKWRAYSQMIRTHWACLYITALGVCLLRRVSWRSQKLDHTVSTGKGKAIPVTGREGP